jgi:hypothetical protein
MSHVRNRGIPSFASTVTQLNLASDTTARFEEPKATPADTECHASVANSHGLQSSLPTLSS